MKKTWTPGGGSPTTTFYVYNMLDQLAAEYSDAAATNGTSYPFMDMLGSVRAVADASGNLVECYDYLPFGRMLGSADNRSAAGCYPNLSQQVASKLPQKFTGKERDAETGLDFFGARYMSAAQGRFTSADPLLNSGRPDDPQSWNRYAYVGNNPLRYKDPTGLYKWNTNCDEEKDSACKADRDRFRAGLENLKKSAADFQQGSKERKQLENIIKRIGEEGKGSTRIAFGDAGGTDQGPNLGRTVGNKITINFAAIDQTRTDSRLIQSESLALDAGVVGHEGAHIGTGGFLTEFLTMHGEHTAYYSESLVYQGLHNNDRPFQLWNESWLAVDQQKFPVEKTREQAIQHILHPDKVAAPVLPQN